MPAPDARTAVLRGRRLTLEPLAPRHARELALALDDPRLHGFTGGAPRTVDEMDARVRRLAAGGPADGSETWCNWVVLCAGDTVGTVQATIAPGGRATLAWVVAVPHQGRGYASEAVALMVAALRDAGVVAFAACIHPAHAASGAVARSIGLRPTDELVDGELRWTSEA